MPVVKFGGRRLLLSASDLVLPLCCGIVLHLFFVVSLCVTHYFLPNTHCTHLIYWFIYFALTCHGLIVIINCIGTYIGFSVQVMHYSVWLTRVLYIRAVLNIVDICIALCGLYLICVGDLQCLHTTPYTLLITCVLINWIILLIGCCGVCCFSSSQPKSKDATDDKEISIREMDEIERIRLSSVHDGSVRASKMESKMRKLCCACLWEHRAWNHGEVGVAFNEMTSMMEMLMQTEHINNETVRNLAPSDVFTGLQLYRMLQKHYQMHDFGFYHPYTAKNYTHKFVNHAINETWLEVDTAIQKTKHKLRNDKTNDDFIELVDVSKSDRKASTKPAPILIPTDEPEEEKYHTPKSKSKSNTPPETPLLDINEDTTHTDGFSTIHLKSKERDSVEMHLDQGRQPRLSHHELNRIEEGIYYSKYAIACYGLPLYTLEHPLGILCAMPCCLPSGVSGDRIHGKACCGLSSIKVFLRRSGIEGTDLLCASQLSGLHQTVYFIAVDRMKKQLVIAVRGSESMPDGMVDVNCKPTHCPSIDDECYCHDGFRLSMLQLFESIEKHSLTQQFLAQNKDYGIVVVGHSLGGAVSILLTLQLLRNKGNNVNYNDREIDCYAIAPATAINTGYAKKIVTETEEHITAFIYNKDIVPRLQWNSVMRTKCAVIRLLTECNKSSWWVYRQGLSVNSKTILSALNDTSKYLKTQFEHDIRSDMNQLSALNSKRRLIGASLWRIKLQHVGMVFHIVNTMETEIEKERRGRVFEKERVCCSYCCSAICNCLRCKCCTPSSINPLRNDRYIVYRADTNGFKDVIISSRMVSDHMPQVYKHVFDSLDFDQLRKLANTNDATN
eukprot:691853_1